MTNSKLQFLQKKHTNLLFYSLFFTYCIYKTINLDFWYDELSWTLNFVHQKSIFEMLHELSQKIYNLPGFYIILYPFYQISHNNIWLRIPSIIFTILAIFYTQKLAAKYYDKHYKFIIWALYLSTPLLHFITLQTRPYAFMIFCSAYSFYMFYQKQEFSNLTNQIKYGISLAILAYSHWFGCLLIAGYGLIDTYLFLTKKHNIKFIIPYPICFFAFIPWLIATLINNIYDTSSYWGEKANLKIIFKILYLITGNKLPFILFLSSLTMIFIKKRLKNIQISPEHSAIFIIFFILSIVTIYSNIKNSASLMVTRYFFIFIPQYIILSTAFIAEIIHKIKTNDTHKISFLLFSLCFSLCIYTICDAKNIYEKTLSHKFADYKKIIELYKNDAKENNVLIWFLEQKFLDIYDTPANFNVVSFMTDENYEASFNKKYFLSFKTVEEYSEHFNNIKTLSCKKGLKYILNKNNLTLYYNYKNGKKDTSLFDKNICDYDIIYIENKVTVSSTILTFLKNHFNITPINIKSSDHENTYKLTRKKN